MEEAIEYHEWLKENIRKYKEKCKICEGKDYHKLSCPNNVNRPKEINLEKPKQR